jgi:hypothetical protein
VAEIDPYDDQIDRWIVWHYRFDPARRQRRNVTVAAYDNVSEFEKCIDAHRHRLLAQQASGEAEAVETIGGGYKPAGHQARMTARRVRPRPKKARKRKR